MVGPYLREASQQQLSLGVTGAPALLPCMKPLGTTDFIDDGI